MARRERFSVVDFKNPSGAMVYRVAGRMPDGRQVRQNFKSFAEALARKGELEVEALGVSVPLASKRTRLSDEELALAEAAIRKLGGKSILTAVDFFLANYKEPVTQRTVEEACQEFLKVKQEHRRVRASTSHDYTSRLNPLRTVYGTVPVSSMTAARLQPLVFKSGQTARTALGNRRVLQTFFTWCIAKKYTASYPVAEIEKPQVDESEPEILSLSEVKSLLRSAWQYKNGILTPYFALGLFAGLRPHEIRQLKWERIDFDQKFIRCVAKVSKKRQNRFVELSDNILDWLRPHTDKPIVGKNWRRDFDAVRRLAGFKGSVRRNKVDESLKEWPEDVCRHTSLSHHFAKHHNDAETAKWAGNSIDDFHANYKGLVKPAEAQVFWELRPSDLEKGVTPMPLAA